MANIVNPQVMIVDSSNPEDIVFSEHMDEFGNLFVHGRKTIEGFTLNTTYTIDRHALQDSRGQVISHCRYLISRALNSETNARLPLLRAHQAILNCIANAIKTKALAK